MNRLARYIAFLVLAAGLVVLAARAVNAEELYNLEVLLKKTYDDWQGDSIKYFGSEVCVLGTVLDILTFCPSHHLPSLL